MSDGFSNPYIEFREVSKSLARNLVLDRVSFDVQAERNSLHTWAERRGEERGASPHHGLHEAGLGTGHRRGQDITDFTEEQIGRVRQKLTMVFQNRRSVRSMSVGENGAFPLRERRSMTEDQIYQIGGRPAEYGRRASPCAICCRRIFRLHEALRGDCPSPGGGAGIACSMTNPPPCRSSYAQLLGDLIKALNIQAQVTSVVVTHDMRLAKKLLTGCSST